MNDVTELNGNGVVRPSWDTVWMTTAFTIRERSRCVRDRVGCVIATADNLLEAATYNGPPPNATGSRFGHRPVVPEEGPCDQWCPRAINKLKRDDYADCRSNHAEANALIRADHSRIQGGTVYVTSTPCVTCAKNLASSGVSRVAYVVDPAKPRDPAMASWLIENLGLIDVTVMEWST